MRFLCLCYFLSVFVSIQAQPKFFPTGVVMKPFRVTVSPPWADSLTRFSFKGALDPAFVKKFNDPNLPANWKTIRQHELAIMTNQDFSSYFTLALCRQINYGLLPNYADLMIYSWHDSIAANTIDYKKILHTKGVHWMINPHQISLESVNGTLMLTVAIQVFYSPTNNLMLNTTVSVTESEALESCDINALDCAINVMVGKLAYQVIDKITRVR